MEKSLEDRVRTLELRNEVLGQGLMLVMEQLAAVDPLKTRNTLRRLATLGADAMPADAALAYEWLVGILQITVEQQARAWQQALAKPKPVPRK